MIGPAGVELLFFFFALIAVMDGAGERNAFIHGGGVPEKAQKAVRTNLVSFAV